jgi:(E)-4-hydroxy-3-methylbut-2-enyl-diphosphate synthase
LIKIASGTTRFDAIPEWKETIRDVTSFSRRRGDLPAQQEGDAVDVRGFLHRDGSVLCSVSLDNLQKMQPEELYRQLGAKLVVGMPFKDVATVDSIYLPQVPYFLVFENARRFDGFIYVHNYLWAG